MELLKTSLDTENLSKNYFEIYYKSFSEKLYYTTGNKIFSSISQMVNIDDVVEIMDPFYRSTGLGVALYDENHVLLKSKGWQKICTLFHKQNTEAHKGCIESERFLTKGFRPDLAIAHKCRNGLWELAFPIFMNDKRIGHVNFGQFFLTGEEIDKNYFLEQAEKYSFDKEKYICFLRNVPILAVEKIESDVELFLMMILKLTGR